MSGDYSRFTHRPKRRYSGVLMQQGRVQLDADWNEHADIVRRRWEIQAEDTFGLSAVPRATTPDGFKISAPTAGDLAIGAGRIYVDGKLAELFPGEQVGASPVPVSYLHQPFFPDPPALPAGAKSVFLDVWDREVTYIEDPDILEKALGGPDTTTRRQTVWQVRIGPTAPAGAGDTLCAAPLPPASGGRLSTRAVAPPASDDPCDLAPSGGFRGLENRLYRLEVHTGGSLAAARFKWSRDNASVVSTVTAIGGSATRSELTVNRIGRDAVLRFAPNDWVEVTDDVRELMGEPGEMARIAIIQEDSRVITLDRKIPTGTGRAFGATAADLSARHTRLRLWNQSSPQNTLDGNGLMAQAGGAWLSLEAGIEVQLFQSGSDPLRTGDYWVFAARVVDSSVEGLDQAEPRGIRHHYSQLAALGASGDIHDCRHLWPEGACCCCTAEVGDGAHSHGDFDDLQEALTQLNQRIPAEIPIVLCLLPGTHRPPKTVEIFRDRVTIRGCGRATHVVAPAGRPAFQLAAKFGALEGIYLTVEDDAGAPAVLCNGSWNRVEGNEVVTRLGPAIWSINAFNLTVAGNRLSGAMPAASGSTTGGTAGNATDGTAASSAASAVERDVLVSGSAATAIVLKSRLDVTALVILDGGTRFARVTGNLIGPGACHGIGLTLSTLWDVVIAGNEIQGLGGSGIATINVRPVVIPGAPLSPHFDEAAVASALFADRQLLRSAGSDTFVIFVATPQRFNHLRLERNTISGNALGTGAPAAGSPPLGGIVLSRLLHVQITGNRIESNGRGQTREPVAGIFIDDCKGLIVRDNVVVDNGPEPNGQALSGPQGGILATTLTVVVDSVNLGTNTAPINQPDGWPAAAVQDNLVVAPRGPALVLTGMGPMQVTGNRFTARDLLAVLPNATPQLESFVGAVLISNLGMAGYLYPQIAAGGLRTQNVQAPVNGTPPTGDDWTVGGKVEFSDNQVSCDFTRGANQTAIAAVGLFTLDDLGLHDNQTECRLLADTLIADTLAVASTVRANGNGFTESMQGVSFSLWSNGLAMSTAVGNQGTHCIVIHGPAGRVRDDDNLAWFCRKDAGQVSFNQAQTDTQTVNL
jgi:hypothetical protein